MVIFGIRHDSPAKGKIFKNKDGEIRSLFF